MGDRICSNLYIFSGFIFLTLLERSFSVCLINLSPPISIIRGFLCTIIQVIFKKVKGIYVINTCWLRNYKNFPFIVRKGLVKCFKSFFVHIKIFIFYYKFFIFESNRKTIFTYIYSTKIFIFNFLPSLLKIF